jgi:hypothetical protein
MEKYHAYDRKSSQGIDDSESMIHRVEYIEFLKMCEFSLKILRNSHKIDILIVI